MFLVRCLELGFKFESLKVKKKGQARSRIDHKNGGSGGMVFFTYLKKSQVIRNLTSTKLIWTGVCEKDYLQEISSDKSDKKPNINQTYQRN